MFKRISWAHITVIWALFIFVVSVIPGPDLPSISMWEPDKIAHFIVYGFLTFSMVRTFQINNSNFRFQPKIAGATLCILYGFCMELIQLFLPTRTFDLFDMLANFTGCMIGLIFIIIFRKKERASL